MHAAAALPATATAAGPAWPSHQLTSCAAGWWEGAGPCLLEHKPQHLCMAWQMTLNLVAPVVVPDVNSRVLSSTT